MYFYPITTNFQIDQIFHHLTEQTRSLYHHIQSLHCFIYIDSISNRYHQLSDQNQGGSRR